MQAHRLGLDGLLGFKDLVLFPGFGLRLSHSALEITPNASAHDSTAQRAASSVRARLSSRRFVSRASNTSRGTPSCDASRALS
jgi:hypothetical protein